MAGKIPAAGHPLPIPSSNVDARNVCSTAGINLVSRERIRLVQVRQAYLNSVKELKSARNWDEFLSRGLLTANLIKANCDAFIEMAGALGDAMMIPGAGNIAKGYGASSAVATAASQAANGQKTDWVGTASSVAKPFVGKAGKLEDFTELNLIKVDIVNYAVRGENAKALQSTFMDLLPKLAAMSLDYMGKTVAKRWTGAAASVINSGINYSRALDEAFNQRLDDADYASSKARMINGLLQKIVGVEGQIREIDSLLQSCATPRPSPSFRRA